MNKIIFIDSCYQCPHVKIKESKDPLLNEIRQDSYCSLTSEKVNYYEIEENCPLEDVESLTGKFN